MTRSIPVIDIDTGDTLMMCEPDADIVHQTGKQMVVSHHGRPATALIMSVDYTAIVTQSVSVRLEPTGIRVKIQN